MREFKRIYIEITNVCNLSCDFCPKTSRKPQFMDIDTFKLIIEKIHKHTKYIYFHIMGEPFLNPNLAEFLDIADEYSLRVNITTNGTLINNVEKEIVNKKALRQVNISLHSFSANESKIQMSEYLKNVFQFVRNTRKSELLVAYRLWNIDSNENKDIIYELEKEYSLKFPIKDQIIDRNGICLCKNVYLNQDKSFEWPDINLNEISSRGFCYGLRTQIGILVDGTVVPCCLDSDGNIPLGNIKTSSLEEIVMSPKALSIYNNFSNKRVVDELCKRCGYRTKFI